jgi:hypothetical protein
MKKIKGVSVQSIIIGSVITGVIAGSGLAALWPSVEKSKINSERTTINEVSNALVGAMEQRMSAITYVNAEVQAQMKKRLTSLPAHFSYHIAVQNLASGEAATFVIAQADVTQSAQVQRLKDVVKDLEVQFDGIGGSGDTGKFRYDTTCTTGKGCFYAVHLADLGISAYTFGTKTTANDLIPVGITTDNLVNTNLADQVSHAALN